MPEGLQKLIFADYTFVSVEKTLDSILIATVFGGQQAHDRVAAFACRAFKHIGRELQALPNLELVRRHQGPFRLAGVGMQGGLRFGHNYTSLPDPRRVARDGDFFFGALPRAAISSARRRAS
jgi:hypothetical protein